MPASTVELKVKVDDAEARRSIARFQQEVNELNKPVYAEWRKQYGHKMFCLGCLLGFTIGTGLTYALHLFT